MHNLLIYVPTCEPHLEDLGPSLTHLASAIWKGGAHSDSRQGRRRDFGSCGRQPLLAGEHAAIPASCCVLWYLSPVLSLPSLYSHTQWADSLPFPMLAQNADMPLVFLGTPNVDGLIF